MTLRHPRLRAHIHAYGLGRDAGANAMLEEAGYVDSDGDGFREAPSGEPLQLIIEVGIHDHYTPIVELVTEFFADIGLNAIMDAKDQSLVRERYTAGDFMIHT